MTHRAVVAIATLVVALTAPACGKRGAPLPPLRPVPARPTDATARRVGDQLEIRFTVPATNADGSSPASITRVEIYAGVGPAPPAGPLVLPIGRISTPLASQPLSVTRFPPARWPVVMTPPVVLRRGELPPPTTAQQLMNARYFRGQIEIEPPPPPAAPTATAAEAVAAATPSAADPRPAVGEIAVFSESLAKERALPASPTTAIVRYLIVPIAGKNRRGTPVMLEVPLRAEPAPPGDLAYSYDEQTVRLSWTSADPAAAFRVYRADASGAEQRPSLTPTSLTVRTFTTPVEFGAERCYHVRAAVVIGPTSVESAPSRPVCFTAADTFPPAAPSALFAQPSQGRIALGWTGVASADLAGYVVLRGEGATPMMQPLFTDPIADTAFTDSTTRAGVRYTYAVVAVDKSGNRSRESNRVEEAGRF